MDFGVIGGTGLYQFAEGGEPLAVATRYGRVEVARARVNDTTVFFLPRHGRGHDIPPHQVNYRANIAALKELGVGNILASAAVGSMCDQLPPGSLALLCQFLDFTHGRPGTFFDGEQGKVVHVDMTSPYCPHLRAELLAAAAALAEEVHAEATYVCAQGPRFETPAEINMFRKLGGDVVGMTNLPEVALAREAGICYAAVAIVTNWAAGVTPEPVRHADVSAFMERHISRVQSLFLQAIGRHRDIACSCRESGAK